MNRAPKLALGTAQWGMPYGIANRTGQTTTAEAGKLLLTAKQHGITLLDTAHGYGDAEQRLGERDVAAHGFRVVTKTRPLRSNAITGQDAALVSAAFLESLRRLGCTQVYGLLVHDADDLLAAGADRLWATLQGFKAQRQVRKIGVSVYHPHQLEAILERYRIDLAQLPFNLYDQRFLQAGLLGRLKQADIEIHSRSAFLQGLLLMPTARLPEHFSALRSHHDRLYRRIAEAGLTPLEACLRFCLCQADIDQVIVGCESAAQLGQILDAAEQGGACLPAPQACAFRDQSIIDPSTWRKSVN